jgi:hypothetical protein
MDAGI